MGERVLLTGGTGFLGGELLRALRASGRSVRLLSRSVAGASPCDGVEVVAGDLLDPRVVGEALRGCSAVIHAAAKVSTWAPDAREFYRTNLDGFQSVADACRTRGVAPLVYTSTFFALGPADPPGAREDSGLDGGHRHPYQHSKLLARLEARRLLRGGFPIVILYPGVIYGPGRRTEGNVIVKLLGDFLDGRVPGVLGGAQVWSYAYVADVAAAHVRALECCAAGGEFVLGGDNVALRDFFRIAARASGRRPPRLSIPPGVARAAAALDLARARLSGRLPAMTPATVAMMSESWALDSTRAREALDYRPRPLAEGLDLTLRWMAGGGAP